MIRAFTAIRITNRWNTADRFTKVPGIAMQSARIPFFLTGKAGERDDT